MYISTCACAHTHTHTRRHICIYEHNYIVACKLHMCRPRQTMCAICIWVCICKCGCYGAISWLNCWSRPEAKIHLDNISFNTIISCCERSQQWQQAGCGLPHVFIDDSDHCWAHCMLTVVMMSVIVMRVYSCNTVMRTTKLMMELLLVQHSTLTRDSSPSRRWLVRKGSNCGTHGLIWLIILVIFGGLHRINLLIHQFQIDFKNPIISQKIIWCPLGSLCSGYSRPCISWVPWPWRGWPRMSSASTASSAPPPRAATGATRCGSSRPWLRHRCSPMPLGSTGTAIPCPCGTLWNHMQPMQAPKDLELSSSKSLRDYSWI